MNEANWYQTLIKPDWAPPSFVFGPVWTGLYILIAISFGAVFYKYFKKEVSKGEVLPFALNIVFNLLFTPLQFGLKSNYLAALDIVLVLTTLIWAMIVIYPKAKWITYMQIPYLLWVSFATVLQFTITFLNW